MDTKALTIIAQRRDMLSVPSVIAALNPIERSICLAAAGKTFLEYKSGELAKDIVKAVHRIAKDVGIREIDDPEYTITRLCEILVKYYPTYSLKDFCLAFEMAVTGELDDYLPKGANGGPDRGHYQQFNAEYVCKILNAYRVRRMLALKKAKDALPAPEPIITPEDEKAARESAKLDCIDAFGYYRITGNLPPLSPIAEMLCYRLLSDAGLAPKIEVTLQEQKAILEKTISALAHSGRAADSRDLREAGSDAPEIQHDAYCLARRKALISAFERMRQSEIDITHYIKLENED